MFLRSIATSLLLFAAGVACHADTLSQHTANTDVATGLNYYGQGFTVSGTGPYNNITFSFLSQAGSNYATGNGYIFATPYAGTPSGLKTASDLGSATSSGGVYTFTPSLVLTAGQTYYFYEDAIPAYGAFGVDTTTGTSYYYSIGSGSTFRNEPFTNDYRVSGTAVNAVTPTPEPSSLTLLATGVLGLASFARKRLARREL